LYNVSGFSLPSIRTDHHHITEKIVEYGENSTQLINQSIQQSVGTHMGMKCAPLLAELFLYSYEAEFI
jgi:hypothetical protein